jgi:hypothetical protein
VTTSQHPERPRPVAGDPLHGEAERSGVTRPPHAGHVVRARPEPGFEISVDGRPATAVPGQTLGAVLYANGVRSWRTTRIGGRPRGLFCGIGVCFDCLVTVNGEASLRACQTEALPGDEVTTG